MASNVQPRYDNTLGAAFIGCLFTAMLFGLTCLQTFNYFQRFNKDPRHLKIYVWSVLASDVTHMALVAHSLYWYMVSNFDNPSVLALIPSTIFAGICITNISDTAIRLFFAWRVWILSRRTYWITIPLISLIIVVFIAGFGFGVAGFSHPTFKTLASISWLLYTGFALAVTGDFYIAIVLCTLLYRSRNGIKRTNSLINLLIIYSINTGLLTSITSAACLFTYISMPTNFIFLALYFPLSKLYVNAMLATLNAREALRNASADPNQFIVSSAVFYCPDGSKSITSTRFTHKIHTHPLTQTGKIHNSESIAGDVQGSMQTLDTGLELEDIKVLRH